MFGATNIGDYAPQWYMPIQQTGVLNDFGGWTQTTTSIYAPEPTVKLTAKKHAVVARATGQVVEAHDSKDEALAAAKRLAAKEQDEYWVFSPTVTVRPKPVDLEPPAFLWLLILYSRDMTVFFV